MTEPTEYTDAHASLVEFRNKILSELVSGRVKAGLDASHAGMVKYRDLIKKLSITPYVFGKIREKGLALKLSGKDVGEGGFAQAKTDFIGSSFPYPMTSPYQVSPRSLPEVDVFKYRPVTDVSLIEGANEEVWRSLFLVQSDHNTFKETPDMENVFYDYYSLRPMGCKKVEATFSGQRTGYSNYGRLESEGTIIALSLTTQADSVLADYYCYCFIDVEIYTDSSKVCSLPVLIYIPPDVAPLEKAILVCAGKHIATDLEGVYAGFVQEGILVGWALVAKSLTFTVEEILWAGTSTIILSVNDPLLGTISPVAGTYEYKTLDKVTVDATPYSDNEIKRWVLDGLQYPASASFTTSMFRNHTLMCVFGLINMKIIRPNANGDLIQLSPYPSGSANYQCVDEAVSDAFGTYVRTHDDFPEYERDIYQLSNTTVPDGAIIDKVTVCVNALGAVAERNRIRTVLKSYGVERYGVWEKMLDVWTVYRTVYYSNPSTGTNWTIDEVNALQAGLQIRKEYSVTWIRGYCTQVWVEVEFHVP